MTTPARALRRLLATLTLALLVGAAAPASLAQRPSAEAAQRLAASLNLTDSQVALVQQHLAGERQPGVMWQLAADLTPTLSDAQRQTLFAGPERPQAREGQRRARPEGARQERPARADRAERADRPGRAARPNRAETRMERPAQGQMGARRQASHEAMHQALDLTPEQAAALRALQSERRGQATERMGHMRERRAERPAPRSGDRAQRAQAGEVPSEIAAILTAEQQEVWRVHRALSHHLMATRLQAGPGRQSRQ